MRSSICSPSPTLACAQHQIFPPHDDIADFIFLIEVFYLLRFLVLAGVAELVNRTIRSPFRHFVATDAKCQGLQFKDPFSSG